MRMGHCATFKECMIFKKPIIPLLQLMLQLISDIVFFIVISERMSIASISRKCLEMLLFDYHTKLRAIVWP